MVGYSRDVMLEHKATNPGSNSDPDINISFIYLKIELTIRKVYFIFLLLTCFFFHKEVKTFNIYTLNRQTLILFVRQ